MPSLVPQGKGRRGIMEREQFFIFMAWASSGMTYSRLSTLLKIPKTTVGEKIPRVIKRFKPFLISKYIPSTYNEIEHICQLEHFTNYPMAWGAVDWTVVPINRPRNNEKQRSYFSGKHHFHCIKFQCVISPSGFCVHYKGIYTGKKHDIKVFQDSNLAGILHSRTRIPSRGVVTVHPELLGDLGYIEAQNDYPEIVFPFKKSRGGELTQEEKDFYRKQSADRIIVENYFSRMKSIFGYIHKKFRGNLELLDDLIPALI